MEGGGGERTWKLGIFIFNGAKSSLPHRRIFIFFTGVVLEILGG